MTKVKNKFIVAFTLIFAMLAALVTPSVASFSAYAADEQTDELSLNTFDNSTGMFAHATATETENLYKSISISLADDFAGNEKITSVEIPESIKMIKSCVFENCLNLKNVKMGRMMVQANFIKFTQIHCCQSEFYKIQPWIL